MAVYTKNRDARPIISAAQEWARSCLQEDGSVFTPGEAIWTLENVGHLDRYFVQRPDAGEGSFYEKLKEQMADAPAPARKLMAEFLWVLLLFPSNISADTKREGVIRSWNWSGDTLDATHPMLRDELLAGVGSAGTAFNNLRWREVVYLVSLCSAFKRLSTQKRGAVLSDYPQFMDWLAQVPMDGDRQFRHMLRYFLFPERVERMSSNRDRRRVLAAFRGEKKSRMRQWSDRQLDEALLELRQEMEAKYQSNDLDFYDPPLRDVWKAGREDPQDDEDTAANDGIAEQSDEYPLPAKPRNLILYGPPGTGKTYRLQGMFDAYTDQPADVDRVTWEQELVAGYGWRPCITAALSELGAPSAVGRLAEHPIVRAKVRQRSRNQSIGNTLHNYLQTHTPTDVQTVRTAARREPFVFTKDEQGRWSLLPNWQERDEEAADLLAAWRAGPEKKALPVHRYRLVTFHPSYSYEDFVIGLRPVSGTDEDSGATEFRMVDGVFKQICNLARTNPGKRYALFIDEINRANIAKVFGELITLVEPDKRAVYDSAGRLTGGVEVQLPGMGVTDSGDLRFGVPANLDIYGTMNTADRSIALLDLALRRRFDFEEMPPLYEHLHTVDGVRLGRLLRTINDRLEYLVDRDHRIGHAYFSPVQSLDDLRGVFQRQVIPLLQEYFFDDWSRIRMVLSAQAGDCAFVSREDLDGAHLFPEGDERFQAVRPRYVVTASSGWTAADFVHVYEAAAPVG